MIKNHIKALRAEKNWSQQDLGEKLGITRQTVASIENGKYSLSLRLAFEIATIFGVGLLDVFEDDNQGGK